MKNSHQGFTLIELMITVGIVAILASIAYPSYNRYILRSHRTEAKSALLQVQVAQEKFFLQYSRYASGSTELSNAPNASPPGLGVASPTTNGYYTITLTGSTTAYTATATYAANQTADTNCKTLQIDNTGTQSSTNSSNAASTDCWAR